MEAIRITEVKLLSRNGIFPSNHLLEAENAMFENFSICDPKEPSLNGFQIS